MIGRVKWFNDEKGFGFISTDDNDYFVHYSNIKSEDKRKTLIENQVVEFDIKDSAKGLEAKNVKIVKGE